MSWIPGEECSFCVSCFSDGECERNISAEGSEVDGGCGYF